jgi:hypothetical protein
MTTQQKRYYYTDPLVAAWMAKHFGMRFYCDALEPFEYEGANDLLQEMGEGEKAYIHSDSLHLLEPKDGDFIEIKDSDYQRGSFITSVQHSHSNALGLPADHAYRKKDYRVIQRDGKPFFWPEISND